MTDGSSIAAAGQIQDLDILVNNAGIMVDGNPATTSDVDSFRRTYETNVFGVVAVTNAFLPALRRSAHPRIVNISSGTGSLAWSTGPNPQFALPDPRNRRRLPVFEDCAEHPDRVLRASTRRGRLQSQCPGSRAAATNLNARAAASGADPGEAAAAAVRLAMLPDDGPTGQFISWDGTIAPW